MSEIQEITEKIRKFTEERDWEQFHNPKDLAIAIGIESGELLECFLWKNPQDAKIEKIREELADVLIYCFRMADKLGLDINDIINDKITKNAEKYPIDKARGTAKKYNEL